MKTLSTISHSTFKGAASCMEDALELIKLGKYSEADMLLCVALGGIQLIRDKMRKEKGQPS